MITRVSFPVRYSEIDKMGIVHHSNYPKWFEIARKDYLEKAGTPSSRLNDSGFYLPLSELECKFKSPAKYGDKIVVFTRISSMSCSKVKFEYRVLNKASGNILAVGETVHGWTDRNIKPLNIEKSALQIYTSLKAFAEATCIKGDIKPVCLHKK